LAEEVWSQLGNTTLASIEKWPEYDEAKIVDDTVEIAVQLNGKFKGTITVASEISKDELLLKVKTDERVAPALDGKTIVKEIVVPNKIVNIVVR
jgi:leucyl-tRNA synthetase